MIRTSKFVVFAHNNNVINWYFHFRSCFFRTAPMGSSPSLRLWKSTPNVFPPAMPGNSVTMSLGLACNYGSKNIFTFFVRTFDRDKNNFIDFKEFLLAIDVTSGGSPKEKLQWAFRWWRHLDEWNQSEYLPFLNQKKSKWTCCIFYICQSGCMMWMGTGWLNCKRWSRL